VDMFKNHADRIREYIQDPGIGYAKVEKILNAAHAIRYQISRNIGVRVLSQEEKRRSCLKDTISLKANILFWNLSPKKRKRPGF